jgi:diacylglycerol kinase family enzyme
LILAWIKVHILNATPSQVDMIEARSERCEIRGCQAQPVSADGEPAGHAPATFTVLPGALRVIVPASDP